MKKFLRAACAGFAFAAAATGFAAAQNGQLSAGASVSESVTTAEIIALMQAVGFEAAFAGEESDGDKTISVTSGGGTIYVVMRQCQGAGVNTPCQTLQPFGLFSASGVTLAHINDYNLNRSRIAVSGLLDNGAGVIGAKIYLNGGVASNNLIFNLALFFNDIDTLVEAFKPGALAAVSYKKRLDEDASAIGITLHKGDYALNPTGAAGPVFVNDEVRAILDRGEKIRN